ncbi:MAG TPA: hypothetical protein VEH28_01280 [Thermoplasmata archaeon]|nr:hypothetical protein [Thermoplasmata archaeon]
MAAPNAPKAAEGAVSEPTEVPTVGALSPADVKVGIGSISDVVFGLALSIGSLILVARTPQNGYALGQGIYYFGFSFLIVILIWFSFRRIVVVLPYETPSTLSVNVALLFCVALEPFLFYVMVTTTSLGNDASTAFAIDLGAGMFLLSVLGYLLLREESSGSIRRFSPEVLGRQRRSNTLHLVVGSIYLLSALPPFWSIAIVGSSARYDLWYFALVWAFAVQARWVAAPRARSASGMANASVSSSRLVRAKARWGGHGSRSLQSSRIRVHEPSRGRWVSVTRRRT